MLKQQKIKLFVVFGPIHHPDSKMNPKLFFQSNNLPKLKEKNNWKLDRSLKNVLIFVVLINIKKMHLYGVTTFKKVL